MAATTWCVVYNTSSDVQTVDDEGHSVDPASWACARRSYVHDKIDAGLLIVIDMANIGDGSAPAARMAKEEATRLNDAIDAEKAKDEDKPMAAEEASDAPKSARSRRN